jgi:hypothetical protein
MLDATNRSLVDWKGEACEALAPRSERRCRERAVRRAGGAESTGIPFGSREQSSLVISEVQSSSDESDGALLRLDPGNLRFPETATANTSKASISHDRLRLQ